MMMFLSTFILYRLSLNFYIRMTEWVKKSDTVTLDVCGACVCVFMYATAAAVSVHSVAKHCVRI